MCYIIGKNSTSIRCWYAFKLVNLNELPTEIVWSKISQRSSRGNSHSPVRCHQPRTIRVDCCRESGVLKWFDDWSWSKKQNRKHTQSIDEEVVLNFIDVSGEVSIWDREGGFS